MSTNIKITVDQSNLTLAVKLIQEAARKAQQQKEDDKKLEDEATKAAAAEDAKRAENGQSLGQNGAGQGSGSLSDRRDAQGNPIFGSNITIPTIRRRPAANRRPRFEVGNFWVFDTFDSVTGLNKRSFGCGDGSQWVSIDIAEFSAGAAVPPHPGGELLEQIPAVPKPDWVGGEGAPIEQPDTYRIWIASNLYTTGEDWGMWFTIDDMNSNHVTRTDETITVLPAGKDAAYIIFRQHGYTEGFWNYAMYYGLKQLDPTGVVSTFSDGRYVFSQGSFQDSYDTADVLYVTNESIKKVNTPGWVTSVLNPSVLGTFSIETVGSSFAVSARPISPLTSAAWEGAWGYTLTHFNNQPGTFYQEPIVDWPQTESEWANERPVFTYPNDYLIANLVYTSPTIDEDWNFGVETDLDSFPSFPNTTFGKLGPAGIIETPINYFWANSQYLGDRTTPGNRVIYGTPSYNYQAETANFGTEEETVNAFALSDLDPNLIHKQVFDLAVDAKFLAYNISSGGRNYIPLSPKADTPFPVGNAIITMYHFADWGKPDYCGQQAASLGFNPT